MESHDDVLELDGYPPEVGSTHFIKGQGDGIVLRKTDKLLLKSEAGAAHKPSSSRSRREM